MTFDSKCRLSLYYLDYRVANTGWCDVCHMAISKQTAKKANDFVAAYFDVTDEWDKKLMKCIFLEKNYHWFHFNRYDSPDVTLEARVAGDKNIVLNACSEEFYEPIEKSGKVAVTLRTGLSSKNRYEFGYEAVKLLNNRDCGIVALFNSISFKCMSQFNIDVGSSKIIEKLDLPAKL